MTNKCNDDWKAKAAPWPVYDSWLACWEWDDEECGIPWVDNPWDDPEGAAAVKQLCLHLPKEKLIEIIDLHEGGTVPPLLSPWALQQFEHAIENKVFQELHPETAPVATPFKILPEPPVIFNGKQVDDWQIPELHYNVSKLVPAGVILLAGAPKAGKSWLVYDLTLSVAQGTTFLGRPVNQAPALYLALEDGPRRIKKRTELILGHGVNRPADWHVQHDWERADKGGLDMLHTILELNLNMRLVVIDILQLFAPRKNTKNGNVYDEDYERVALIKELAKYHPQVSFVLVTHTRKMTDPCDVFIEISGSTGLTGGVDQMMILKRPRMEKMATLTITGRDLDEDQEIHLEWSKDQCRYLASNNPYVGTTGEQMKVLMYLKEHSYQCTTAELNANVLKRGDTPNGCKAASKVLTKMKDDYGLITSPKKGKWTLPEDSPFAKAS